MPERKNKGNGTKTFLEFIICLAVLGAGGYFVKKSVDNSKIIQSSDFSDSYTGEIIEENIEPEQPEFSVLSVSTDDVHSGELILVNNDHQYMEAGKEDLVSILEMNENNDRYFFTSVDYDYLIRRSVYEPMARMIEAFYNQYGIDNLVIYGSYRTNEFQKQLYEADLESTGEETSTLVAKPGYSEHETGYAFDFSTTPDYEYDGTGEYSWFNENCEDYGFIMRYPEEKSDLTYIRYEPWHYRYVGIPHATYIMDNNICLEEYIDMLRNNYTYDYSHLSVTDHAGIEYEIYYCPASTDSEITSIPVPSSDSYYVSGNNVDGFIVTVYKSSSGSVAEPETTENEEVQEEEYSE